MFSKVTKWLTGKRDVTVRDELKTLGLHTISDQKLEGRIVEYADFHEHIKECSEMSITLTPEAKLEMISKHVHNINAKLHQVAVPWGRAGDTSWYAEAMGGWSTIQTRSLDMITSTRIIIAKSEKEGKASYASVIQKEEIVAKLCYFFEVFYLKYALLIAEISWRTEDVSPQYAVTVVMPKSDRDYGGQAPPRILSQEGDTRQLDMMETMTRQQEDILKRLEERERGRESDVK